MEAELSKPKQSLAATEAGGELAASTLLASLVVSVEHGWLCIRNDGGWLLWNDKIDQLHNGSIALTEIEDQLRRNQASWLRDQAEMLEAEANGKLRHSPSEGQP